MDNEVHGLINYMD